MSKYLRSSVFETEFDGDRIRATLKPLRQEDGLKVVASQRAADRVAEISRLAGELVPLYVEKIEGLVTADGSPVTIQELASDMYFAQLRTQLFGELVTRASPKDPTPPGALLDVASPGLPSQSLKASNGAA